MQHTEMENIVNDWFEKIKNDPKSGSNCQQTQKDLPGTTSLVYGSYYLLHVAAFIYYKHEF